MHFWSSIAAALALAVIVSAQAARPSAPTMVLPMVGVPLSVESVTETVAKDSPKEISTTKYYRDAAGRIRIERELPQAFGDPLLMIQIDDPIDGFMAILEIEAKIARRVKRPKGVFGGGFFDASLGAVPGKKTVKNEDLGKQTIDEIEFQGSRMTVTADEQPSLVAFDEYWMSQELGLWGSFKHSGPDGERSATIRHVERKAPDPKLFVIPDDYRIRDMTP